MAFALSTVRYTLASDSDPRRSLGSRIDRGRVVRLAVERVPWRGRAMPLYPPPPPPRRGIPGLFAALCFVLGPALAWLRLVPPLTGFGVFALAGLAGLVIGIRTAVRALRGRSFTRGGLVALVVGVA